MISKLTDKKDYSYALPYVSVIVVNYNHGSYIRSAIDSILNQTFTDFEIIVVDDGSQDNSRAIIKKIINQSAKKIEFLCHENNQNLGISKTYKLALSKAKGKYIAFLEADDQWDNNYLQTKIEILDSFHSVGVVFSKYKIMSNSLYGFDMHLRQKWLEIFIEPKRPFSIFQKMIKRNNIATFSAFVTRKCLLDTISIDLPQQFFFLDWWVLLQLSMKSKFYFDKKSVVYWRHHRESTLGKQTFNEHKNRLSEFLKMISEKIGKEYHNLSRKDQLGYRKKMNSLPYFIKFYNNFNIINSLKFLRVDPVWAGEALLSYLVNYYKHSQ